MSAFDPSFVHNLVQLIHHTTTAGKPIAHTLVLRSQASFALGWVVSLYEWGTDPAGGQGLRGWEGGWKGEKGIKQMEKLVPDLTALAFSRRIATHIASGQLHVDGFKTGNEKSFKLSITHPDKTYDPFDIPLKALAPELVSRQAFDFLKDSVSLSSVHRMGAAPREPSIDPEPLLDVAPVDGMTIELLKSKLDAEIAAHKRTKAELRDTLEHEDRIAGSQPAPVFKTRKGQDLANSNIKANRTMEPVFADEGSSSDDDAAPAGIANAADVTSAEATESEEDLPVDKASQSRSQSQSQSQAKPKPSSQLPPSSSVANGSQSQAKSKSSMGPPPPRASGRQPVASSSKLRESFVKSSPQGKLSRQGRSSSAGPESDDLVATQVGSSQLASPSQRKDTALVQPPSIKKSTKRKAAKRKARFGNESSSEEEEEPSQLAVKANAKPTKLPPLKKTRVLRSDSSSSPEAEAEPASKTKSKGKQRSAPKPVAFKMDVDGSGSATE